MKPKFYLNYGRRCAQTAIKSVINLDVSYEILDSLTGRKNEQITSPLQIAYALSKLKQNFIYPVKKSFFDNSLPIIKRDSYKMFGKENYKKTNFKFIEDARKELLNSGDYSIKNKFDLCNINELLSKGKNLICLINYNIFVGSKDEKQGHYVIVFEIQEKFARIMDSGPINFSSDKEISIKRLEDSLMETPMDYGMIFV